MSQKKKYSVPRAPKPEPVGFLQVKGVKSKYIKALKDEAHELGYTSYGEYLNALFNKVFDEAGNKVQKKGRRAS